MKLLQQAVAVGKLNIVWRSNMGERGCLQTSQLERYLAVSFLHYTPYLSMRLRCFLALFFNLATSL